MARGYHWHKRRQSKPDQVNSTTEPMWFRKYHRLARNGPCALPAWRREAPGARRSSTNRKIYHDTTTNWDLASALLSRHSEHRRPAGLYLHDNCAVTQTSQNYEGTWPDIGQQLANNLTYPPRTPLHVRPRIRSPRGGAFPARHHSSRSSGTWTLMQRIHTRCSGTSESQAVE